MNCQPVQRNFNSIKVQLKHQHAPTASSRVEFQFHKGTIKTTITPVIFTSLSKFQFHKGTIKTSLL